MSKPVLTLPKDTHPEAPVPLRERAACAKCRYAGPHDSNDNWRFCRARSPDFGPMNGRAIWPVTTINDWCGDFCE